MATYIEDADNILWQQPSFTSPSTGERGAGTYTEKWKGAYDRLKDIPGNLSAGMSVNDVHTKLVGSGFILSSAYNIPDAGQYIGADGNLHTAHWQWNSATVIELVAGALAEIELQYKREGDKDEQDIKPDSEEWGISWQAYTVSPYSFCAQDNHQDVKTTAAQQAPDDQKSNRNHIKTAYNVMQNTDSQTATVGVYTPAGSTTGALQLNKHEKAILNKVMQEKVALYHYPIITRRAAYNDRPIELSADILSTDTQGLLGAGIDCIRTLPTSCPIEVAPPVWDSGAQWQWVLIDDQAKITLSPGLSTCSAVRQAQWQGSLSADVNFYGDTDIGEISGRWKIGDM